MHIFVYPIHRLGVSERRRIADHLTKSGSVFQQALASGSPLKGDIATLHLGGDIFAWARSDEWEGKRTLEAFTASEMRKRGMATACAAALVASGCFRRLNFKIAVFQPSMASLARRLGLDCQLYDRKPDGSWRAVQE